jgi:hypothetical protein
MAHGTDEKSMENRTYRMRRDERNEGQRSHMRSEAEKSIRTSYDQI